MRRQLILMSFCRRLFRDVRFTLLFAAGAIATFPLLVPPFFLPLYTESMGMPSSVGAGVVAAFNFSSALGRLICGFCSDRLGPLNTLLLSLLLSALSMLILWPVSVSIGPLIVFVIINGMANGGFFSTIPTVVGNVFGSARVSVAMGMTVTGWAGGYLLVIFEHWLRFMLTSDLGRSNCRLYTRCIWRRGRRHCIVSPGHILRRRHGFQRGRVGHTSSAEDGCKAVQKALTLPEE